LNELIINNADVQYVNLQTHLKNAIHDKYPYPTCFGTRVPSSGSLSDQRNTIPTG